MSTSDHQTVITHLLLNLFYDFISQCIINAALHAQAVLVLAPGKSEVDDETELDIHRVRFRHFFSEAHAKAPTASNQS